MPAFGGLDGKTALVTGAGSGLGEAIAKALGTGFRHGVFWRDMGVVNLPSGRPTLRLTGGAARALERITPEGHEVRIDLSITDDFPTAQAIVIITAFKVPTRD